MANDAAQSLLVRIEATTAQLQRELKAADKSVGKHEKTVEQRLAKARKHFEQAGKRVAKYGAAVGVAAAAAGAAMVKSGLSQIDTLAKVSSKLGIATDELAKLRFAAEQTGVSSETLDMALQRMTRRVAEAGQGTGEAVKALEELGLSAKDLAAQSPDEVFRQVAGAMEGVDNQSDKLRLAFKLFDSEGAALVNTLAAGTDGLDAMGREAEAAGLAITNDMAKKVEGANDSLNRVSKLTEGFSQQLAVQFAPILAEIGDRLFGVGSESVNMASLAGVAFEKIINAVGFVGDAFRGLEIVFLTIKTGVMTLVTAMLAGLDMILNAASDLASKIPGVDLDYDGSTFAQFYDGLVEDTFESAQAVRDKLNEPLPSDAIEDLVKAANDSFATMPEAARVNVEKVAEEVEVAEVAIKEVADTVEETSAVVEVETSSMAQSTSAMSTAVTRGFERMRDAVGDFFKNMILDGRASFGDLADMFKSVIAEMIATAASNRIMLSLGLGGASGSAMATPGFGGGIGGIGSSFMTGIGNLGAGVMTGVGHGASFLADIGVPGMDWLSSSAYGRGMTMTPGNALAGAGAGLAGGYLGNRVFGETSGVGSTIGSTIGMAAGGPIGAAIGSFLGSGLESLIGNNEPSDMTGTAMLNLGTGDVVIGGLGGKKFSQENRDAAGDIAAMLSQFSGAIGGSSGTLDIGVGSRDGLRLDGVDYGQDQMAFLSNAMDKVIDGATNLTGGLQTLFKEFEGGAEETIALADGLVGMNEQIGSLSAETIDYITNAGLSAEGTVALTATIVGMRDSGAELTPVMEGVIQRFEGSTQEALAFSASLVGLEESGQLARPQVEALIKEFDGTATQTTALMGVLGAYGDAMTNASLRIVRAYEGTGEESVRLVAALGNLGIALNTDAVDSARDAYDLAGQTIAESYALQTGKLNTLISEFTATTENTQTLANELGTTKQVAFQLATQLMETAAGLDALTASSAESIRQSIMSEDELRQSRKAEINSLVEELRVLSDPQDIKTTVSEIERLNMLVFQSLGPEKQKQQAEAFAGFIEKVNSTAQRRLQQGIHNLERTQSNINAAVGGALDSAASRMGSAADTMASAAANIPSNISVDVNVNVSQPSQQSGSTRGFAKGGYASPGLAIVGEEGPELVRFKRPGFVHTASQTRQMLGGGDDTKAELQALAVMMSRQLKLWQRVTRNGESLRTVAA